LGGKVLEIRPKAARLRADQGLDTALAQLLRKEDAVRRETLRTRDFEDVGLAMRDRERGDNKLAGTPGELKTVPFTLTNVEGIGPVAYGTMSFAVSHATVTSSTRIAFGEGLSGFMVTGE
jgi:hypothetical protein